MLASLASFVKKENLHCLHVEHGLRSSQECKGDAVFVSDFCEKLGISCRIETIPQGKIARYAKRKGTGIEAAARVFRRTAFLKEAQRLGENTLILTAHTRNDALELALMRILRGSGPAGLARMPIKRGRFLRPLLSVSRSDVIGYLNEKKISWREDASNKDEKFLRNKVRKRLVPLLNEAFPSWKKGLSGMAETQSLAAAFLAEEAKQRIKWEKTSDGGLTADSQNFFSQPQIIREEALFQAIDLFPSLRDKTAIKRSVVRKFCNGSKGDDGSVNAADLGSLRVKKSGGKVTLTPMLREYFEKGFSLLIKEPGLYNLNKTDFKVCPFSENPSGEFFLASLPLVLREGFNDDFLICKGKKITLRDVPKNSLSALDTFGLAAFIGENVLFKRDVPPCLHEQLFSIEVIIKYLPLKRQIPMR